MQMMRVTWAAILIAVLLAAGCLLFAITVKG
jgi:hypothetical protein